MSQADADDREADRPRLLREGDRESTGSGKQANGMRR
jgi:hypothetical protein